MSLTKNTFVEYKTVYIPVKNTHVMNLISMKESWDSSHQDKKRQILKEESESENTESEI
jgi:hypothetical protein